MATDLGDLSRLSRVELEPVLCRCIVLGETDNAAAIRAELESRTWQNVNPYAVDAPESDLTAAGAPAGS